MKAKLLIPLLLVALSLPLSPLVGADVGSTPVTSATYQGAAAPASHHNLLASDGRTFTVPACQFLDPTGQGRLRPSLAVGVNNFGTFMDPETASPTGTGFQVPAGQASESLANGWWGHGWFLDVAGNSFSYYPSGPSVGAITRINDHWEDSASHTRYVATLYLGKGDLAVLLDREFVIDHETCDVTVRTRVENQGGATVPVYFKEVVDWDVIFPTITLFANCWQNIPGGVSASVPTIPGNCTSPPRASCSTTALGFQPHAIDFDAWDDLASVGTGASYFPVPAPPHADWNAGFHYRRAMAPNDVWTLFHRYECNTY